MGVIQAKIISLMSPNQFATTIPEELSEITMGAGSWQSMTESANFKEWYGDTQFVEDATWKGKSIGDVYIVKGRLSLKDKNVLRIAKMGLRLIHADELQDFLAENNGFI